MNINKKTMLGAAIVGLLISIVALLIFSLDRTSWLFAIFETGRDNGEMLGKVAAIVVELAAVALITSKIVINKQDHLREYRYIVFGLVVVLGVQTIGNLIAGWIRGSKPIHALFSEGNFTGIVAAVTWLVVNACIPILIYILSELLAYVIRLLLEYERPSDLPSFIQLFMQLDSAQAALGRALERGKQWRELARRRRVQFQRLRARMREKIAIADRIVDDLKQQNQDEQMKIRIEAAQRYDDLLDRSSKYHQSAIATIESLDNQIAALQKELADRRAPAPPDINDFIEWLADSSCTIGDLARAMLDYKDGNKSAAAEAFGTSPVAFGKWISIRGGEIMEDSYNGNH